MTRIVIAAGLGSARASPAGDGVPAIVDFSFDLPHTPSDELTVKVRFGETPKPARETRALPKQ